MALKLEDLEQHRISLLSKMTDSESNQGQLFKELEQKHKEDISRIELELEER